MIFEIPGTTREVLDEPEYDDRTALPAKTELLLAEIKHCYVTCLDLKFRKGAREHGGDLLDLPIETLLTEAFKENLDQAVFLLAAMKKLGMKVVLDDSWI